MENSLLCSSSFSPYDNGWLSLWKKNNMLPFLNTVKLNPVDAAASLSFFFSPYKITDIYLVNLKVIWEEKNPPVLQIISQWF